jgi:hypothetical protein
MPGIVNPAGIREFEVRAFLFKKSDTGVNSPLVSGVQGIPPSFKFISEFNFPHKKSIFLSRNTVKLSN